MLDAILQAGSLVAFMVLVVVIHRLFNREPKPMATRNKH